MAKIRPYRGIFLINPFDRLRSPYKWFNKQGEKPYDRLRKRIYYMLYGDGGSRPSIPYFAIASRLRDIMNVNQKQTQFESRDQTPHLGLLDYDPLTLLSMGVISLSSLMARKVSQLKLTHRYGEAAVLGTVMGFFNLFIRFPIAIASTLFSIVAAPIKSIAAAVVSSILALIAYPLLKEDTTVDVIRPTPPPPPTEEQKAFSRMKVNAMMLGQIKRQATRENDVPVGNDIFHPDIMARIAMYAAQPQDKPRVQIQARPAGELPMAVRLQIEARQLVNPMTNDEIVAASAKWYAANRVGDPSQNQPEKRSWFRRR